MARTGDIYDKGFAEVEANLNRELERIKNASIQGLIKAAAHIRNTTEHTPPVTPLDTGNLRASWFVVTAKSNPVGKSAGFKGDKAGVMAMEHTMTIAEAQAWAAANSTGKLKFIMIGYSANYALYVHENIGAQYWSRASSGPKWFETAVKGESAKILQIVKDNVQIL
jgi:hypothetical protein